MDTYIGKMLNDRYEILDLIGYGSTADVYKAQDHRLGRIVAIKVLNDEFSNDEAALHRFYEVSQKIASLSHTNIVDIFDVNQHQDIHYIVMEYLEGITLKQFITYKKVLNWNETVYFSLRIINALEYAHEHGVIHHDLKPQNVIIMRDGTVKVTDFSISHISSVENTISRARLDSVYYISPEQTNGNSAGARSDIYSLGVMMYEMLTGSVPFDGDSPVAVAVQHLNGNPVLPRKISPNIPIGLQQITMHAMNPDLNSRYNTTTGMRKDLETLQANPRVGFRFHVPSVQTAVQTPDIEKVDTSAQNPTPCNPPIIAQDTNNQVPEENSRVAPIINAGEQETSVSAAPDASSVVQQAFDSSQSQETECIDNDLDFEIDAEDFAPEEGEDLSFDPIDLPSNETDPQSSDIDDALSNLYDDYYDEDETDEESDEDEDETAHHGGTIAAIIIILLILAIIGVTVFYFRALIIPYLITGWNTVVDFIKSKIG